MPSNRFGSGSGRYYHNTSSDGRKSSNSAAHVKSEPENSAKIKSEFSPKPSSREDENKFKSTAANIPEIQGQKMPPHERKFTQRSRLFIGNLPLDMTEDEFKKLFSTYGEISETFINAEKGFGFVRLDTRANAEKAKWELDGFTLRNRQLRVRFATHGAALSVKNISPQVSNELLEEAFSQFGQVERAVVIVDDRGRSTERGIVEFARKSSAAKALQQIREGCFLLTASPRAISASNLDQEDSEDGLPERNMQKTPAYYQEREVPPRFAQGGTFEEEFARRWKALDDLEKYQREQMDKNIHAAKEKLEMEMENAIQEHRNMLMKQELLRRQEELQRLEDARKREMDRRQQLELAREEARQKELQELQRQQELLRAQIEGTYKADPYRGSLPRSGSGYGGRAPSPTSQSILQEALAQEMMAGQGGLGPAPKNQSDIKQYHFILSNMKKLMGRIDQTNPENDYFSLAFRDCPIEICKCQAKATEGVSYSGIFSLLESCPTCVSCQTFDQWKFQHRVIKINKFFSKVLKGAMNIYFLPIGPFPDFIHQYKGVNGRNLFELICEYLKLFFTGFCVKILEEKSIEEFPHVTHRTNTFTNKSQYLITDFFPTLKSFLPRDGCCIVALTWVDLYPCENLNFLLGQGSSEHFSCISSFGRFDPTYVKGFKGNSHGTPLDQIKDIEKIDATLLYKLIKVITHETCHVFGLYHCSIFACLMNASSSTEEVLKQPMLLCPFCMKKIRYFCLSYVKTKRFRVRSHLAAILHFLQIVFLDNEEFKNLDNPSEKMTMKRIRDNVEFIYKVLNLI